MQKAMIFQTYVSALLCEYLSSTLSSDEYVWGPNQTLWPWCWAELQCSVIHHCEYWITTWWERCRPRFSSHHVPAVFCWAVWSGVTHQQLCGASLMPRVSEVIKPRCHVCQSEPTMPCARVLLFGMDDCNFLNKCEKTKGKFKTVPAQ